MFTKEQLLALALALEEASKAAAPQPKPKGGFLGLWHREPEPRRDAGTPIHLELFCQREQTGEWAPYQLEALRVRVGRVPLLLLFGEGAVLGTPVGNYWHIPLKATRGRNLFTRNRFLPDIPTPFTVVDQGAVLDALPAFWELDRFAIRLSPPRARSMARLLYHALPHVIWDEPLPGYTDPWDHPRLYEEPVSFYFYPRDRERSTFLAPKMGFVAIDLKLDPGFRRLVEENPRARKELNWDEKMARVPKDFFFILLFSPDSSWLAAVRKPEESGPWSPSTFPLNRVELGGRRGSIVWDRYYDSFALAPLIEGLKPPTPEVVIPQIMEEEQLTETRLGWVLEEFPAVG